MFTLIDTAKKKEIFPIPCHSLKADITYGTLKVMTGEHAGAAIQEP